MPEPLSITVAVWLFENIIIWILLVMFFILLGILIYMSIKLLLEQIKKTSY
jgi:hypothetical protein